MCVVSERWGEGVLDINVAVSERGDEAAHCETGDIAHLLTLGDERLQRITMLETVQADRNWCELWMQWKLVVVLSELPNKVGESKDRFVIFAYWPSRLASEENEFAAEISKYFVKRRDRILVLQSQGGVCTWVSQDM